MEIEYLQFSPDREDLLEQLITCYQAVFASPPWNEWLTCSVCATKWGDEQKAEIEAQAFSCCGQSVVPYWPAERVRQDIEEEIHPPTSCWLAVQDGKVVGFCWGYPIEITKLEEKIGITLERDRIADYDLTPSSIVLYQDELGVLKSHRRRGIGRELVRRRHQDFLKLGHTVAVMRTMQTPPSITYHWYTEAGFRPVAHYTNGKVILARQLAGLVL